MFLKPRGSVTVFLCIILTVVISLSGLLIDLARYNMAKKQVENALKLTVESMLAAYDRQLREQYGLFATYPRNKSILKGEIYDLFSQNLNVGTSVDGVFDLYGFNVGNIDVIQFYNLSEPDVLQQQVAEFMKYRAPVQVMQELYEKIKLMTGLMEEAKIIENKMQVDRLMNDIRESLVYVYFMINHKLSAFNNLSGSSEKTLKDSVMEKCNVCENEIKKAIENCNNAVEGVNVAQDEYIKNYPDYDAAKKNKDDSEKKLNDIKKDIQGKEERIERLSKLLDDENYTGNKVDIQRGIERIKDSLNDLYEQKNSAQEDFEKAKKAFDEIDNKMTKIKNELEEKLKTTAKNLWLACDEIEIMETELQLLQFHSEEHKKYNDDVLKIIEEIETKLNELDKESKEIKKKISKRESAVSDRIGGDLEKQLKYFEKKTYSEISSQLKSNLNLLDEWITAIETCKNVLNNSYLNILGALKDVGEVLEKPQDENNRYKGVNVDTGFEKLETGLVQLRALGKMDGIYSIPDFELAPAPVDTEKKAFDNWFGEKYEGKSPQKQKESDSTELDNIKSNAKGLADILVYGNDSQQDKDENEDKDETETICLDKTGLPSDKGATSSDAEIEKIAELLNIAELNKAINEVFPHLNPLEEPAQGFDNVNEHDKNYYNFELERIFKLFDLITEALKDGVEEIGEGLYMNEYIVSAFKCATSFDNQIEHDIGWNRPLDKTFFNKAEVEYILFGNIKESSNINWSKTSVFSIRLVFNLLHVYTSPQKLAQTLSLATSIAGWTIFGVPLVQNFLLLTWAAAESYFDMHVLFNGGNVPLIKTSGSWKLDLGSLSQFITGEIIEKAKDYAQEQLNKTVDNVTESIEETIEGIIDAKVDKAFAPFEKGLTDAANEVADSVDEIGNSISNKLSNLRTKINFNNADDFTKSLDNVLCNYVNNISDQIRSFGQDTLANVKNSFKDKLKKSIFEWDPYKEMIKRIKNYGNDLIDKGFDMAAEKIDDALGAAGKSPGDNITGRLILMDYTDYLRLMLIAVSKENKALRTADLIQVNLQNVSGVKHTIDNYYTYIFVKADVDFKPWFLPEHLFKKEGAGMISVVWSQGY